MAGGELRLGNYISMPLIPYYQQKQRNHITTVRNFGLVIVTKVSARRGEDGSWIPAFSRDCGGSR
jgi:hypothetical protein